jgi:hypothetical protein
MSLDLFGRMQLDLINSALEDVDRLKGRLEALRSALQNGSDQPAEQPIKNRDGRLTEFGLAKLRSMLDAGHSPSDIARALDVSPSAIIHQRNRYLAEMAQDFGQGPGKRS